MVPVRGVCLSSQPCIFLFIMQPPWHFSFPQAFFVLPPIPPGQILGAIWGLVGEIRYCHCWFNIIGPGKTKGGKKSDAAFDPLFFGDASSLAQASLWVCFTKASDFSHIHFCFFSKHFTFFFAGDQKCYRSEVNLVLKIGSNTIGQQRGLGRQGIPQQELLLLLRQKGSRYFHTLQAIGIALTCVASIYKTTWVSKTRKGGKVRWEANWQVLDIWLIIAPKLMG